MTITVEKDQVHVPVLASGKGWLVVEKPSGMSVHNEPGADLCSLVAYSVEAHPPFRDELAYDSDFGVHPVHRLDKDTSGAVLLACRPDTFRLCSRQFEEGRVHKRYIALVHGILESPAGEDEWGLWDFPLSKDAGGRLHPAGKGAKLECRTRFRVLRHSAHYTLLECELVTGRKHQIRRHAKLAGHAVVGDERYGTPRSIKYVREQCGFHRLGLHALSITVQVPGRKKPLTVESRKIPPEMQQLLDRDEASTI